MAFSILPTKLHKPQLTDSVIPRSELLKNSNLASVILVSAQAGSGKSTIVSSWLSEQNKVYCWYNLDDWDNDLMQFFAYLAAGIKPIDMVVSEALEQLLDAFQSIGFESFLKVLINQLHTITSPFIFVFDDYHLIRNEHIHQVLRTMIEHFPPLMQLVLITREDPPFPLAKLRAGKKLFELRISQLRFTEEEVNAFFLQQLNVTLEEAQLKHLFKRTEGWIAGLQMTALSMQGHTDINGFIDAFTSSHYYIMDYLMEEVLEQQPQEIKSFLLTTSILEAFSGELCDAVLQLETGTGRTIIERLVKTNCFILSTDSSHHWYRYHHLFKELLKQRLDYQSKSELEKLHLRAGLWLAANGHIQEAIRHLLAANAFINAAALIECKWAEMDVQLQSASWLDMAKTLPANIIDSSPVLALGYGWALLDMGEIEASHVWFDKAQDLYNRCQTEVDPEDIIISDKTQFDLFPATIASARGYIAAATGDVEKVFIYSQEALIRIPSNQYYIRGMVSMLLAIAHWGTGDLQEAERVISECLKSFGSFLNPLVENSFYMVLGELYIQQKAFSKAKAIIENTISRVSEQNRVPILLASLHLSLAKVAFLQNNIKDAYVLLEQSKEYGQHYALMDWKYKYNLLLARVYCTEGYYDLARDCIIEGKANYFMNPLPDEITLEEMEIKIDNEEKSHQIHPAFEIEEPEKSENKQPLKKEYANQLLTEPLTVRELEVLSLIVSGLSNKKICDTLFLALSTVKGYNQNIFGKLHVNHRTQAVAKAKELGLI